MGKSSSGAIAKTPINPEELLTEAPFSPPIPFNVDLSRTITGALNYTSQPGKDLPTLKHALNDIFSTHTAAILITSNYSFASIKSESTENIFLFDSHSRNSQGLPVSDGTAVLIEFNSFEEITNHIHNLFGISGQYF